MRGEHGGVVLEEGPYEGSSPHARGALHVSRGDEIGGGIIPACAGSTPESMLLYIASAGSSPHARGAHVQRRAVPNTVGIIPACAGSTSPRAASGTARWDHPRMRGEHMLRKAASSGVVGSSPHARGAHQQHQPLPAQHGIIPACAGSTSRPGRSRWSRRDHPRMRGEHQAAPHDGERHAGIIPACAGSTASARHLSPRQRDHPRMRGEHLAARCIRNCSLGSSPHARGARSRSARAAPPRRDHPRMRGEHTRPLICMSGREGSSPHARGAHDLARRDAERAGIIPACAGSTVVDLQPCQSNHTRFVHFHERSGEMN